MMDLKPVSSSAQVDSADGTNKKIKRSHSPPPQDDGPGPDHPPTILLISPAPLNQLGEDELLLIFKNSCITTGDLINLRLVGKSWRDAASSTLLQRNSLCIAHSKKKWSLCQQQQQQKQQQQRGDKIKGVLRGTLSKLTRLMSKSSKFQVSTFQFMFDPYFPRDDYFAPSTELRFFQFHGAKVKELCLLGSIALEPLLEFLSTYAPNIELLDLNQVHFLHLPPISQKAITEERSDKLSNLIPIKTLEIGKCGDQFNAQALHLLLSSCPKLDSIINMECPPLKFFQTDENGDGTSTTVKNPLRKVETLLMQGLCLPRNSESSLMSQFFPNLCRLEIECKNFQNFSNFLWPLFPSVEFLLLYNISWGGGLNNEVEMSILTDLIFTGFALELCDKLRHSDLPEFKNEAEGLNFLRITPSVCDMLRLKELKFMFVELWAQFATRVTGIYAFSQMPNTQFTIYYDPIKFSKDRDQYIAEDIDHAELCFGSIKPYVQIVHVEQPDD